MLIPGIQDRKLRVTAGAALFLLAILLSLSTSLTGWTPSNWIYLPSYIVSGHWVIGMAIRNLLRGRVFDEYSLMTLATAGAIFIGEIPEATAVMLFYEFGEWMQHLSVKNVQRRIEDLIDQRPDTARVINEEGNKTMIPAEEVEAGTRIWVHRGERVPIDSTLESQGATLNQQDITGESQAVSLRKGEEVWSGSLNEGASIQLRTLRKYEESTFSRMIALTQKAREQKAPTERFFRKFAKVYTPVVALLALLIFVLPYFFVATYDYSVWLYRACVFLVISCPCALVLSIPLTYFAGIGAASRSGILVKGANFLDIIRKIKAIIFDKTGTLTTGQLKVDRIQPKEGHSSLLLSAVRKLATQSHHPSSRAISAYLKDLASEEVSLSNAKEVPGRGMEAQWKGKTIRLGNPSWASTLLEEDGADSEVSVNYDGEHQFSFFLRDTLKKDAPSTLQKLRSQGLRTMILSGDRKGPVASIASQLDIGQYRFELSPEEKLNQLNQWRNTFHPLAYAGDGLNDSAVMAASDVGIGMGNTASDVTLETSDIVIPGSQLTKILSLRQIANSTHAILWQNIAIVFLVKLLVLALGAVGFVSLWMAIVADVGVCLVAVANASRLLYMYRQEKTPIEKG